MLKTGITIAAATVAALLASAGAASAAPQHLPVLPSGPSLVTAHALTYLTDRPDGGNGSPNPYWADDTFTRDLTITETGSRDGRQRCTFTATLKDAGRSPPSRARKPRTGPGLCG